jgi:hypothetical protein
MIPADCIREAAQAQGDDIQGAPSICHLEAQEEQIRRMLSPLPQLNIRYLVAINRTGVGAG